MTGNVLALAMMAMAMFADPSPTGRRTPPALELGPCIDVDESAVANLIELELRDAPARDAALAISVVVRCTDDGPEIRVEPWASLSDEGIRRIAVQQGDASDPAAREARVRELALAIAELIRRLEITHPVAPPPPPPPPPPPVVAPPAPEQAHDRWTLGFVSAFEHFAGGQTFGGGDLTFGLAAGSWFWAELRTGARVGPAATFTTGSVVTRAGTAAVAAACNLCRGCRTVRLALLARLQGYLVEYRLASSGPAEQAPARLGAMIAALEPHLRVALSRRVSLVMSGAAGIPLHGIVVRTQDAALASVSGLVLSGQLGAAVSF